LDPLRKSRHFVPRPTFKNSACFLLLYSTPLLEEKWDFGLKELIPNIRNLQKGDFVKRRCIIWSKEVGNQYLFTDTDKMVNVQGIMKDPVYCGESDNQTGA
jgi:hypothetical protein